MFQDLVVLRPDDVAVFFSIRNAQKNRGKCFKISLCPGRIMWEHKIWKRDLRISSVFSIRNAPATTEGKHFKIAIWGGLNAHSGRPRNGTQHGYRRPKLAQKVCQDLSTMPARGPSRAAWRVDRSAGVREALRYAN